MTIRRGARKRPESNRMVSCRCRGARASSPFAALATVVVATAALSVLAQLAACSSGTPRVPTSSPSTADWPMRRSRTRSAVRVLRPGDALLTPSLSSSSAANQRSTAEQGTHRARRASGALAPEMTSPNFRAFSCPATVKPRTAVNATALHTRPDPILGRALTWAQERAAEMPR
jgi:hypothetical protein